MIFLNNITTSSNFSYFFRNHMPFFHPFPNGQSSNANNQI